MLKVEGPSNLLVYSGKEVDAIYLGRQADSNAAGENKLATLEAQVREAIKIDPKISGLSKELVMEKGKRVFMQTCFACHQSEGQGLPAVFPPLAKSDFLMADKERSIRAVVKGLSGPVTVNGQTFNGVMPPVMLTDDQVAHVLTYVRNSWGNSADVVTVDEVKRVHAESANQ